VGAVSAPARRSSQERRPAGSTAGSVVRNAEGTMEDTRTLRELGEEELEQVCGGKLVLANPGGQPHGASAATFTQSGNLPPGQNKDLPPGQQQQLGL
jgi:hypothetical protein